MTREAAQGTYDDLRVGQEACFERVITKQDVLAFAALTGDQNPLHVDEAFGKMSAFGSTIVHGMLAGSLFSTLVGMYLPGEVALYLGQTLRFRKPIFPESTVSVRGRITNKNDTLRLITMKTEIVLEGTLVIDGEATVQCTR